jgi:RimJ/RimL family protein N-acetyltransferase
MIFLEKVNELRMVRQTMLVTENFQKCEYKRSTEIRTDIDQGKIGVSVREIKPDDVELVHEMHNRSSINSLYYRYLLANKPSVQCLENLYLSNGGSGGVLVATIKGTNERIAAIACYQINQNDPTTAEPAILVEDSYQGKGLGKQLVIALCKNAKQHGIKVFTAFVDPSNLRIMRLIQNSGLSYERKYSDGMIEIKVKLPENENFLTS